MRRLLLPALLLLAISGNVPRSREVVVDPALVQHLETLEQWVEDQTNPFEVWVPVPALLTWESTPSGAFEHALAVYEPFYAEMDALWSDPLSREHMRCGRLWRPVPAHLEKTRECVLLLVARAVHEARNLGDMQACISHLEQAVGYSRSLGTDSWGAGMTVCAEGVVTFALPRVLCAGLRVGAESTAELRRILGSADIPIGESLEREWWRRTRKTYLEHASDARELLALAAR